MKKNFKKSWQCVLNTLSSWNRLILDLGKKEFVLIFYVHVISLCTLIDERCHSSSINSIETFFICFKNIPRSLIHTFITVHCKSYKNSSREIINLADLGFYESHYNIVNIILQERSTKLQDYEKIIRCIRRCTAVCLQISSDQLFLSYILTYHTYKIHYIDIDIRIFTYNSRCG